MSPADINFTGGIVLWPARTPVDQRAPPPGPVQSFQPAMFGLWRDWQPHCGNTLAIHEHESGTPRSKVTSRPIVIFPLATSLATMSTVGHSPA
ncbi:MAG: hypothetical protein JOZ65_08725 [Chloroflexi bacterium]|nr:hypothetical protein [Chloroflexota bacterium]